MPAAAFNILDAGAVAFAELARDVEAQPRALRLGGEERLEEMRLDLARDAGTVVDHVELQPPGNRRGREDEPHRPGHLPAVAPGVAREVPQHLVEMLAVEPYAIGGAHLHVD